MSDKYLELGNSGFTKKLAQQLGLPRPARSRQGSVVLDLGHDGVFGAWAFHKKGNGGFTQVLARAAAAYADVQSMQADFAMTMTNPLLRRTTNSRGTMSQLRPDRIALRFTQPDGDVIVSDGEYFWIYYPSVDEKQVIRMPASQGATGGVDLQAQFIGDPTERFEATLHGTEDVGGRPAYALTLVPRGNVGYKSLEVWLDTRDYLARRFEITEENGSVRRFDLSSLRTNVRLGDDVFRFTPPADARIVDRR